MKIFLVDDKYSYVGNPGDKKRYSSQYYLEYKPLKKLAEKYGHSVKAFWFDEMIQEYGRSGARDKFWEAVSNEKPDVCMVYAVEHNLGKDLLEKLRDQNFTTMVYSCGDDAWRWNSVSRHFVKYFSWVITYDPGSVEKYKNIGFENIIYARSGVNLDEFKKTDAKKDIDVSFVGLWSKPRARIIEYLKSAGIDVYVRGAGWPGGPVSHEELVDIINRTKINLSLIPPSFYVGWRSIFRLFFRRSYQGEGGLSVKLDIMNFFDNLRTLLGKKARQVKVRQFEVPACGGFQITQDADDLSERYVFGEEIVTYEDNEDLVKKIKYYLNHPEEREEIAKRGYERTLRDHNAEKRFEKIFATLGHPITSSN